MLNPATVRSIGRLDGATAIDIADHWNTAYPAMRAVMNARIEADRENLHPGQPDADALRTRLKRQEKLRLVLGQLDRGTHRACTQSGGGFSTRSAYAAVRGVLKASSPDDDMTVVRELEATLSRACEQERRAFTTAQS